jgi:hypothetical protein
MSIWPNFAARAGPKHRINGNWQVRADSWPQLWRNNQPVPATEPFQNRPAAGD